MSTVAELRQTLRHRAYRLGGWVYFIQPAGGGHIKIGFSTDVCQRMAALQRMSPLPLGLVGLLAGSQALEACLHQAFTELRVHGEWFRATGELAQFVRQRARQPDSWFARQARYPIERWPIIPLARLVVEGVEKRPRSVQRARRPRPESVVVTDEMHRRAAEIMDDVLIAAGYRHSPTESQVQL